MLMDGIRTHTELILSKYIGNIGGLSTPGKRPTEYLSTSLMNPSLLDRLGTEESGVMS